MAISHNRILLHAIVTNQLFSQVNVAYCFLLRAVFCFIVFFLTCFCWCRLVCMSPLFLLIVDIFGDFADFAPLSPPNGALCCGTSHFSLCIITACHRNITMSQIRCR